MVSSTSFLGCNALSDENGKNIISIAMATDDNYVYPTVTAMTSMLENKSEDTYLKFYIMVSGTISNKNKKRISLLEDIYDNCSVDLINMKDKFTSTYLCSSYITTPTYYRLCLPSLLPQYDKVLYLDGDIIVRKDLWEIYNTDISGNYIAAVKDFGKISGGAYYAKRLGVDDMNQYVNAGVLSLNLKKMREDNMEQKFNEFIPTLKSRKLTLNDQDVLNATCYNKIKFLSPEYNAMQHFKFSYDNIGILTDCYDSVEWRKACTDPIIVHYSSSSKPWKNSGCRFYSDWNKYRNIVEDNLYNKTIEEGVYNIVSALNSRKVIDIYRAGKTNGSNVQLYDYNGTNAQKFKITYVGQECYEIEAMCSGRVLDVVRAGKTNGTNVFQYARNNTDAQKWYIAPVGGGYYNIVSKCNNLCLDVSKGCTKNGTNIQCWANNGTKCQQFKFLRTS